MNRASFVSVSSEKRMWIDVPYPLGRRGDVRLMTESGLIVFPEF